MGDLTTKKKGTYQLICKGGLVIFLFFSVISQSYARKYDHFYYPHYGIRVSLPATKWEVQPYTESVLDSLNDLFKAKPNKKRPYNTARATIILRHYRKYTDTGNSGEWTSYKPSKPIYNGNCSYSMQSYAGDGKEQADQTALKFLFIHNQEVFVLECTAHKRHYRRYKQTFFKIAGSMEFD